jgi:DNA-directed RNA polymerase specialized sigma24 family protein
MASADSVTAWLGRFRAGDDTALAELHRRYWPVAVALARQRLQGTPVRVGDEEDVAQSAFWGLYQAVREHRVVCLEHRHHLLALLSTIVACKAINLVKRELAQKRGGGQTRTGVALDALAADETYIPLQQALLSDCYDHFLNALPGSLRPYAERHLAGYTNKEIANQLGKVERTVERKMALVMARWRERVTGSINQDVAAFIQPGG